MQKINFEDATLVTQAKVTISGNDYEVTPATYSGGTDLDADTLNDLQDNIEASFKNTSSNSTTDGYSCKYVEDNFRAKINYTSNEIYTGKSINGSKVYAKLFSGSWDGTNPANLTINVGSNIVIQDVRGYCNDGMYKRPLNSNWSQAQALSMIYSNNEVLITQSGSSQTISYVNYQVIVEYTKTS